MAFPVNYGREDIKKIIPHREPMLLVDTLTGIDLEAESIAGTRYMDKGDPVFSGHFPDYPVYPGTMEIEMIGQVGLCLYHFLTAKNHIIGENARPVEVRATKVLGAYYLGPVTPGDDVRILARKLDYDGMFASIIGQTIVGETVCCVAVGEVFFPNP
jgi:3-hydroxymyristoyl/3-hydroxydecanoyl-(acyl carrier protein) dehydratase